MKNKESSKLSEKSSNDLKDQETNNIANKANNAISFFPKFNSNLSENDANNNELFKSNFFGNK